MQNKSLNSPEHFCIFLSYSSSHCLSLYLSSLSTECDYLPVRGALAVAVKYMAAINVLAGWAIPLFPPGFG